MLKTNLCYAYQYWNRNTHIFAPDLQLKYNRPIFNPVYNDVGTYQIHESTSFTSFVKELTGDAGLTMTLQNQKLLPKLKKFLIRALSIDANGKSPNKQQSRILLPTLLYHIPNGAP
jgi:hypothetical protein